MSIYTKTGDAGQTSLADNQRVSKADHRLEASNCRVSPLFNSLRTRIRMHNSSGSKTNFSTSGLR